MRVSNGWFAVSPLVLVVGSCAPPAPPLTGAGAFPDGTRAEVVRVMLPAEPRLAAACLARCEDLFRVRDSHHSCLARCPGASFEIGASCMGVAEGHCFDRIVAVRSEPSTDDREVAKATLIGLAFLLQLGVHVAVEVLCDDYGRGTRCGEP